MSNSASPSSSAASSDGALRLRGAQRRHLRGLAHHLEPLVQLGKEGPSEALRRQLDRTLNDHELVKLRFLDFKRDKKTICEDLAADLEAAFIGSIGHVAIFYRPARDPDDRQIVLPG
ncbi:MAG: YhbY family RNA-binding protein [Acidobacteriota bacterium]